MDVVEDEQRTDEIQNKEGNEKGNKEQRNEKTTDGKENDGSDEQRKNKTTDDRKNGNKRKVKGKVIVSGLGIRIVQGIQRQQLSSSMA